MSDDEYWLLPGPRRFAAEIATSSRRGKSFAVFAPAGLVPELAVAIRSHLRQLETRVDGLSPDSTPLAALLEHYPEDGSVRDLRTIFSAENCSCRVFIAENRTPATWPEWRTLLQSFQHRATAADEYSRPALVVVTSSVEAILAEDVALAVRHWQAAWTHADATALAQSYVRGSSRDGLLDRIIAQTIACLALWDRDLHAYLGDLSRETLLGSNESLARFAREKGWTETTELSVDAGTLGHVDRELLTHSGFLAIPAANLELRAARTAELNRRRWQAQATVLLPWIEVRRVALIRDAVRFLPKELLDANDPLEVGPLGYELGRINAPANLRRRASWLIKARNTLAHFRSLTVGEIRELVRETPTPPVV